jgi:GNAT superfamily N-acetyltransferase
MGEYSISHEEGPSPDEERTIHLGIARGDPSDVGPRAYSRLSWIARAQDGSVIGGLLAARVWSWLIIDALWVAEPLRGRGLGSCLLQQAEQTAASQGCTDALLGTFDFQALGFYEGHGYRVYGQLDGFPTGHVHYHMAKPLTTAMAVPASPAAGFSH